MTRTLLAAVLATSFLSALSACGPELQTEQPDELKAQRSRTTSAPSYALKTTDAHQSGVEPVFNSSFPLASTSDIYLATEISGALSGHHTQTVFLFTPAGYAYQRFDLAFATDVPAGAGEQQAEKTASGYRVWVTLPVAGTMIQSSNLVGTWKSELYVDSASTPNARGSFGLY